MQTIPRLIYCLKTLEQPSLQLEILDILRCLKWLTDVISPDPDTRSPEGRQVSGAFPMLPAERAAALPGTEIRCIVRCSIRSGMTGEQRWLAWNVVIIELFYNRPGVGLRFPAPTTQTDCCWPWGFLSIYVLQTSGAGSLDNVSMKQRT